jgi:hypothetical protein
LSCDSLTKDQCWCIYIRFSKFFSLVLTKTGKNISNNQQIYQMAINYNKCP